MILRRFLEGLEADKGHSGAPSGGPDVIIFGENEDYSTPIQRYSTKEYDKATDIRSSQDIGRMYKEICFAGKCDRYIQVIATKEIAITKVYCTVVP